MIALEELRDSSRKAFPPEVLAPPREASWATIAELGWLLVDLPEGDGGLGLGTAEIMTILFEQGRVLASAPLIPALLGLKAVVASQLGDRTDWIEGICGGAYVPLHLLPARVEAAQDGTLNGTVPGLFEADMAKHVLIGLADRYLLVPVGAPGTRLIEQPLWDETRRQFDLELHGYRPDPGLVLAEGAAAKAMHDRLSPFAQLALAADALGGANAVFEQTVDYLKLRKQFDRPLALFQALKHRVADCKVRLAAAEALLWSRANEAELNAVDAGALKALATRTFQAVAEEAIQLHGGIGLTQEHPCHLFLKRAFLNGVLCGTGDHWDEAAGRAALAAHPA